MTESSNNNKKYHNRGNWNKSSKRQTLEIGQRGFLATCNFRERDCIRECYNLLNHYANELYGPIEKNPNEKDEDPEQPAEETDISDDLQKEIDAAKAASKPGKLCRFNSIDTGTKNCIFIKTTLPNPVELGTRIIKDIAETKVQKTRYLLRLTPIEVVCQASVDEITKAAGALFDKYFLKEGKTFAIVFNRRFNNDIKRDEIIKILADLVFDKNMKNKVDLKNGELAVIVEIIKKRCCLSVVEGYFKYKKYNLIELASNKTTDTESTDQKETDKKATEEDVEVKETEEKNDDKPLDDNEQSNQDEPSPKKFKAAEEKTSNSDPAEESQIKTDAN
ncbi:THUMP domain-containing protein 1 homolog [Eupeodes corollae]|uniref:THUMP domain-containing protein 1 homolog n=1 Tax=Eupeodes corollae TaxID=290404 RepID=UPI0024935E08|nr:THUMP domain-containing protein 1 homolog [Eupeodes corollae]